MAADEETRAVEYRRSLAAREASLRTRERSLASSAVALATFRQRWRPWTDPQPSVVEPRDSSVVN